MVTFRSVYTMGYTMACWIAISPTATMSRATFSIVVEDSSSPAENDPVGSGRQEESSKHRVLAQSCPSGWFEASGTIYDSWPKPGTTECVEYSGCEWAGMFSTIDGGSKKCCCKNGAKWLDGGDGTFNCRIPPTKVKQMKVAATWDQDASLLGKTLQVLVATNPSKRVKANVKDVCNDDDCDGCCSENSSNGRYKLIDLEAQVASLLLGLNYSDPDFDVNDIDTPPNQRTGAKPWTIPLCYKIVS